MAWIFFPMSRVRLFSYPQLKAICQSWGYVGFGKEELHGHEAMYPGQCRVLGMLRTPSERSSLPILKVQDD